MENIFNKTKTELEEWFKKHGYEKVRVGIYENSSIYLKTKLSNEDKIRFMNDFKSEIKLKNATYSKNGDLKYYTYKSELQSIKDFINDVENNLKNKNIKFNNIFIIKDLTIHTDAKLSENQIFEIEKEYNLKCEDYTINCDKQYSYIFN